MWAWFLPQTHRPVCFGVKEPFDLLLSGLEDTAVTTVMEPVLRGPDCPGEPGSVEGTFHLFGTT